MTEKATNPKLHRLNICFLGPDGVGKGTVISSLLLNHNAQYFHLKPRKKIAPSVQNQNTNSPHQLPQYSHVKTFIKLIYLFIEYQVYWYINCVILRDRERFCVFDRYVDDILVDPKRFRLKGNALIRKLVVKFLPKPHIYFILDASADEIFRRKNELSLREIDRQLKVYRLMVDERKYIRINAEQPVEKIISDINKHINMIEIL